MTTAIDTARSFLGRGWAPVPVPARSKAPKVAAWQQMRLTADELPAHFNGEQNVGVILGEPSNGLIDLDLDCPEAVKLAAELLPPTEAVFGRAGSPGSHRLYTAEADSCGKVQRFKAPDGETLVEYRATGGQTVFPGSVHESGEPIAWETDGDPQHVSAPELLKATRELAAAVMLLRKYPSDGGRHDFAMHLAGGLLRAGWHVQNTQRFLRAIAVAAGDDEIEDRMTAIADTKMALMNDQATGWPHLAKMIGSETVDAVRGFLKLLHGDGGSAARTPVSEVSANTSEAPTFDLTDDGNARRIADRFGDVLRYLHGRDQWLIWDNHRWVVDRSGRIVEAARKMVHEIAAESKQEQDEKRRQAILAWAARSHDEPRIRRAIKLAQSDKRLAVTPEQLDADGWLLNCESGTIDLRDGQLRPHRREDLITRLSPVAYNPKARLPLWDRVLRDATGGFASDGDPEVMEFIQAAAGYSSTADGREEVVFLAHGPTMSGKSTIVEAIKSTLGDYAVTANFEAFLQRSQVGGARNDIARLAGSRFVTSIEVDEGKRLAAGLMKMLTGRDTVTARFLYCEEFEFRPTFKLWLVANHVPRVDADDAAMWRRILLVPFMHTVPPDKVDRSIKTTLTNPAEAGPAILAWLVEGCLRWQRSGLLIPRAVRTATDDYRRDQDPLADFVDECVTVGPGLETTPRALRRTYLDWCERESVKNPVGVKRMAAKLRSVGAVEDRKMGGRFWRGVALTNFGQEQNTLGGLKNAVS